MDKYFTNTYATFRESPSKVAKKISDIPQNTVVESDGFIDSDFQRIAYNFRFGWVARSHIDPYRETLPKNCVEIPDQTPDPRDFEQYFYLDGIKQVNFCGQLAICYAAGMQLDRFIATMKIQAPVLWKRLKGGGKFNGTTPADLLQMCGAIGLNAQLLEVVTKDTFLNRSRYTVAGLQKLTDMGFSLVACKIDAVTGRLRGQGVGHWVIITGVWPERTGARVQLYNPAPNRIEEYSWQEVLASMVQPYGIWIERPYHES